MTHTAIWGRSLASASPSEPLPNQPKLGTNKLDIERPDGCIRRPAAEPPADRGRLSLKAFAKPTASQIPPRTGLGIAARMARDHLVVEDTGELAKHCLATVPDFHDVEEPDSKPTKPQCRGLRHFPSCWRLVPIMSRGPGCLTFLWSGGCCEWRPLS